VTEHTKERISEPEEMTIARQWLSKKAPMAMDTHTAIGQLLVAVLSMWSIPRLYNEDQHGLWGGKRRVMRQKNMVMGPVGPETKNDRAGKASSNVPDRVTNQQG
jgi:hypothetical protein